MRSIEKGELNRESEELDLNMRFNEYILTSLRTKWGLDLNWIKNEFGVDLHERFNKELVSYRDSYTILDDHLMLNTEGLLLADRFASDLFLVE